MEATVIKARSSNPPGVVQGQAQAVDQKQVWVHRLRMCTE